MSKELGPSEFRSTWRLWQDAYPPANARECEMWKVDWDQALGELPYIVNLRSQRCETNERLVFTRASFSLSEGNVEGVQADLSKAWNGEVTGGMKSIHAFRASSSSLEMLWAVLLPEEAYVTGQILLERK